MEWQIRLVSEVKSLPRGPIACQVAKPDWLHAVPLASISVYGTFVSFQRESHAFTRLPFLPFPHGIAPPTPIRNSSRAHARLECGTVRACGPSDHSVIPSTREAQNDSNTHLVIVMNTVCEGSARSQMTIPKPTEDDVNRLIDRRCPLRCNVCTRCLQPRASDTSCRVFIMNDLPQVAMDPCRRL